MNRQKENTQSLVYAYGAIPPHTNEHVMAEIEKQRLMWNALVDVDREHERNLDALMRETMPEYEEAARYLDQCWEKLRETIGMRNQERVKLRKKEVPMNQAVKEAVSLRNHARKNTWKVAAKWRRENKDLLKKVNEIRKEKVKAVRQNSGLYWGNYNRVLDSYETARKLCMKKGRKVQYFDESRVDGCLTVQVQRTKSGLGASPDELMNGSFYPVQIKHVDPEVEMLPRAARTRACKTELTMRVDAAGHMVTCPLWLHRSMPRNARIKRAQLVWKKEGEQIKGKLCLTISQEKQEKINPAVSARGIDMGWRKQADGSLLVATSVSSDGEWFCYALPADWMKGMDQVERLHAHIDDGLLVAADFIYKNKESLPEIITSSSSWKPGLGARHVNAQALHDAVRALKWEVPDEILHWYKRYRHLSLWRDNLRAKLIRRRREIYRLAARKIALSSAVVGIEDMDLSKMAMTKKRDDAQENELWEEARANRVRACVHQLRSEIEHQAAKHGTQVIYATANTTMRCRDCGSVTGQNRREKKVWTCENCGARWDQDHNAAGNLLAVAVDNANVELLAGPGDGKSMEYHPIVPRKKGVRGNRAAV